MVSTIVHQPQTTVQPAHQEIIYRAPVTGKVCRAIVLHEGDTMLKVQGVDFGGDPRWIGKDDVLAYLADNTPEPPRPPVTRAQTIAPDGKVLQPPRSQPPAAKNSEITQKVASPTPQTVSASAPETAIESAPRLACWGSVALPLTSVEPKVRPPCEHENLILMPAMDADPRFAYNIEREKLSALYAEWQDEREYVGMLRSAFNCPATPEQRERLARYEARYRAQLHIVAEEKKRLTPAHLAWYQEEAHRLAAADFTRISPHNEQLIADAEA